MNWFERCFDKAISGKPMGRLEKIGLWLSAFVDAVVGFITGEGK